MNSAEFAGWVWAIVGAVVGVSIASLIVLSVVVSAIKQVRGLGVTDDSSETS